MTPPKTPPETPRDDGPSPGWRRIVPRPVRRSAPWRLGATLAGYVARGNLGFMAAGIAFFAIFSMVPALAAVIALFGLLADPIVVMEQIALVEDVLPDVAYDIIASQIARLLATRADTLTLATVISVGVAIFSARAAVAALIVGLNRLHGFENRTGLSHFIAATLLTLALIGVALVALLSVVVAPIVLAFLQLPPEIAGQAQVLRWAITGAVLVITLSLVYRWGPNFDGPRPPFWNWGALVAVGLWVVTSVAFSIYLANFADYNEVYGSFGAVIGLMLWLYLSAFIVLFGAAFNAALARLRRSSGNPGVPPR